MSTTTQHEPTTTSTDGSGRQPSTDREAAGLWRVIAAREVTTKLGDRAFLGGIAFTLAIVVVAFIVTFFVSAQTTSYDVAVVEDETPILTAAAASLSGGEDDPVAVDPVEVADAEAAEAAVTDGDADVALLRTDEGYELVSESGADSGLEAALRAAVSEAALTANAQAQGVDLEQLAAGSELGTRELDEREESGPRSAIAFGFAIVFLMTAIGFGMAIAQAVVREKESRVVEILAAAVPIRALLWGKVVGNSVLALGQVVLLVAVSLAGLAATGYGDLLAGISGAMAWYVVLFVLGFVTLAALWSVAGSLASKQEDLGSTTVPVQMLLFIPYFVALLAGETVRTVFSMLPIVSTMVMPGRIAEGGVPLWQIGVAIGSTLVAAIVFVRVGERVFERTVLRTGGKLGYREALSIKE